jgi:polysaccharide lyase-like protein
LSARTAGASERLLPNRGAVFCFGDPTYSTSGFAGDTTSKGWIRQAPFGHPSRVSYDDSVNVMQSLGCHTIRAELRSGDLDTNGGTINLRAQMYKYPSPKLYEALGTNRGQTTWYGFAFSTNAGYVPQSNPNAPNWNIVFSWHGTVAGGGNPMSLLVATKRVSTIACNHATRYLRWPRTKPHLLLEVNGGDPTRWPIGGATCLHFSGPVFVAGHRYRVQEKVKWSDDYRGAIQWWVDGVKYADVNHICTLQLGGDVYPVFQNYRPFALSFPAAAIYYGGLVKGATRASVSVPVKR